MQTLTKENSTKTLTKEEHLSEPAQIHQKPVLVDYLINSEDMELTRFEKRALKIQEQIEQSSVEEDNKCKYGSNSHCKLPLVLNPVKLEIMLGVKLNFICPYIEEKEDKNYGCSILD